MHRPFSYAVNRWNADVTRTPDPFAPRGKRTPSPTQRRRHEACRPPRNGHTHHIQYPNPDDFP